MAITDSKNASKAATDGKKKGAKKRSQIGGKSGKPNFGTYIYRVLKEVSVAIEIHAFVGTCIPHCLSSGCGDSAWAHAARWAARTHAVSFRRPTMGAAIDDVHVVIARAVRN